MTSAHASPMSLVHPARIAVGAAGGLVGGLGFGILLQAMGMMPVIADLVGSTSAGVGWAVHLFNSLLFGAIFGLLLSRWLTDLAPAAALGMVYGVFWWVVGALWIMPAWLGMNEMIFEIGDPQWQSFVGHLFYGLLLAVTYLVMLPRVSRG